MNLLCNYKFDFYDLLSQIINTEYLQENKYVKLIMMTLALCVSIFSINLLDNVYVKLILSLIGISSLSLLSLIILTSCSTLLGFVGSLIVVLLLHINLLPTIAEHITSFFYYNHHHSSSCCRKSKKSNKHCKSKHTREMKTCDLLNMCKFSKTFRYDTTELHDKLFNYSI